MAEASCRGIWGNGLAHHEQWGYAEESLGEYLGRKGWGYITRGTGYEGLGQGYGEPWEAGRGSRAGAEDGP